MTWVLVQMALSLGTGAASTATLTTPEGVGVAAPSGAKFREVVLGAHGPAYVARGKGWTAGLFVEVVADAPATAQRTFGTVATRQPARGADRWDLAATDLRGTGGTKAHALAYGAGAVASGNDPLSVILIAADERWVTVMASARDPDTAHRVAAKVAESVAFKSLGRDARLVGCYTARARERRMCLGASGAFSSCAPGEAACVADICRQPDDGRWFTSKGVLYLAYLTGPMRFGPYSLGPALSFRGEKWERGDVCGERR